MANFTRSTTDVDQLERSLHAIVSMDEYYDSADFDLLIDELSSDTLTETTEEDTLSESDHSSSSGSFRNKDNKSNGTRKPRRNRYHPDPVSDCQVVLKPKILKSDIRRSYASMLANVINSGDFSLMYGMLETFFTPTFEQIIVKTKPEDQSVSTFVRQGLTNIATSFYTIMHIDPDPVITIKDTKIHLISNTTASKIVTEWSYAATSIYFREDDNEEDCPKKREHDLIESARQSQEALINSNNSSSSSSSNSHHKRKEAGVDPEVASRQQTIQMITESIESVKKTLPLRETPLPFTFGGKLTLYTDENKVITRMEMEMLEPEREKKMGLKVFDKGTLRVV